MKRFTCNLCDALCGLVATVEGRSITSIRGDPDDRFSRGHICPKGAALGELFHDPKRLKTPMRRTSRGWEPIGWDEAIDESAARLRAIQREHGRDAVGVYIGNPTAHSHRAALGSQALTMALGSKNRFDPNSQDSNPRIFACLQVYGDGLSMTVPDVDRTHHLFILGANPAVSQGSQMSMGDARARLKAIRSRGGKIVVVDPRRTETAAWADEHCFIRPGGDAALLLSMIGVLFDEQRIDRARVNEIATGLEVLRAAARRFPPERVSPAIGIAPERIRSMARAIADAPSAAVYARVGSCQADFGPVASWLVEAINVVTGNFDREGGVMFPRPAADIGPLARLLVGNVYGRWTSRVRGLPELAGALPSAVMSEEMETTGPGQIRGFVSFAGNPVLSTPNGARLDRALGGLEFMVAIDLYLNETTRHAHIVMPPLTALETGNYDILMLGLAVRNLAKYSPPIVEPDPNGRDDWDILTSLAFALRGGPSWAQGAFRRLVHHVPELAMDLLLRFGPYGLSLELLAERPEGIDLGPMTPGRREHVHHRGSLVHLAPAPFLSDLPRLERWVDAAPEKLVLIGRRHLRSNNSWMNGLPMLAKGPSKTALVVHPDDAARAGISDGSSVDIESRTGSVNAVAKVSDEIMPGVVSLPHGYAVPNVNALTDERRVEPVLGTSILNGVPVAISRSPP